MIPKIIHYCWFGRNPLPELAVKCINSWKKFLPDYEIWEWNEDGIQPSDNALADKYMAFNVNSIIYTTQAYKARKYAFVSDYVRFWALYEYGGIYFDTDVEVIRNMRHIIELGPFMACETNGSSTEMANIAPGLGISAPPSFALYKEILDFYSTLKFYKDDGTMNQTTVVTYISDIFKKFHLRAVDEVMLVNDVYLYPKDYFCPKDYISGKIVITNNTVCIHHYGASWLPLRKKLFLLFVKTIGLNNLNKIVRLKHVIFRD